MHRATFAAMVRSMGGNLLYHADYLVRWDSWTESLFCVPCCHRSLSEAIAINLMSACPSASLQRLPAHDPFKGIQHHKAGHHCVVLFPVAHHVERGYPCCCS